MRDFLITVAVSIPFFYILCNLIWSEEESEEGSGFMAWVVLMVAIITYVITLDHFGIHITLVGPRP